MYTKDKNTRITLRLNEEQFLYVRDNADLLGVSPSEFLRMVVNLSMATERKYNDKISESLERGLRRENENANRNNIV